MQWLAGILALLIAIAGWFYLFYSKAAHKLTGLENAAINTRRIRLRRVAGVVLLLLASCFYAGFSRLDAPLSAGEFIAIWGAVLVLLLCVVVLGLIDLRYTIRFYNQREQNQQGDESTK